MKKYLLAGALAAASIAPNANAAANLVSVSVDSQAALVGPTTGRVWNTTLDGFYTVFLQQPLSNVLNSTVGNPAINDPTSLGANDFFISGEGFTRDPFYRLTLNFADGATLVGVYQRNSDPEDFITSSTTVAGTRYTLDSFNWNRTAQDYVSAYTYQAGGSTTDYIGGFSFTATAVPEPASWAMLLAGFAMIGGALRTRRGRKNGLAAA